MVEGDIHAVDFSKYAGPDRPDLLTGGFPCQPFSSIGARAGISDARGTLFHEFARAVRDIHPRAFLAENVPGLATIDDGATLSAMIRILKSLKYSVQYAIIDAADYGIPQHRRRLIILGLDDTVDPGLNNILVPPGLPHVPLHEALRDVPPSPGYLYAPKYADIYRLVPPAATGGTSPRMSPPGSHPGSPTRAARRASPGASRGTPYRRPSRRRRVASSTLQSIRTR